MQSQLVIAQSIVCAIHLVAIMKVMHESRDKMKGYYYDCSDWPTSPASAIRCILVTVYTELPRGVQ